MNHDTHDGRRKARAFKAVMAADKIASRVGRTDVVHVQQTVLAVVAECNAIWKALLDRNLITEDQRQDYLDWGMADLLAKIDGKANEVIVADANVYGSRN